MERIAQVLEVKTADIENAVECLKEKYGAPNSGIRVLRLEGSAQMCTNPAFCVILHPEYAEGRAPAPPEGPSRNRLYCVLV